MIKHTYRLQEEKVERRGCFASLHDCYAAFFSCKNSLLQSTKGYLITINAIKSGHIRKRGKRWQKPALDTFCNCSSFSSSSFITLPSTYRRAHMQCLQQSLRLSGGHPQGTTAPGKVAETLESQTQVLWEIYPPSPSGGSVQHCDTEPEVGRRQQVSIQLSKQQLKLQDTGSWQQTGI